MTVYVESLLRTFQLEGVSFALDDESRRRLMAISAVPFLAVAAIVAQSWLTVVIGYPPVHTPEALERGAGAAGLALWVLAPLSLAALIGVGSLNLTDGERMWSLLLAAAAALVALGFAVTAVVMALALGRQLALQYFVNTWATLGGDLGLIAAGYAYCARPRRDSDS
jgi:hypothetical protein